MGAVVFGRLPEQKDMKKILLLLLLVSSTLGKDEIQNELKTWVKSLEKIQSLDLPKGPPISCYTEDDILQKDPKFIVLKDKTRIEAQEFRDYVPEGPGKLIHGHHHASNDSFIKGTFRNGCLEGLVKGYEYLPLDGIPDDPSYDEALVTSIGYYKHGYPVGPSWKILYSPDGIILGYFYSENQVVPKVPNQDVNYLKDVIYLYPDLQHGIKGHFNDKGLLISGKKGQVSGLKNGNLVKAIDFDTEGLEIKADLATKTHLNLHPMTRDPYEATVVEVQKSTIAKAGDGVFLTRDVEANTAVSFFNGIRITKNDVFSWNPFKKSSVYLVETTDETGNDVFLDIPQNYVSWKKYQASAGHKINHSKSPNVAYTECEHPVFGKILCAYTLKDLTKGTELFTQYEVAMDKEGMKTVLKAALEIGHRYTGKSRKEFAKEVRPYLELASKFAEKINVDYLLSF